MLLRARLNGTVASCRLERLAGAHDALDLSRRNAFNTAALLPPAAAAALPPSAAARPPAQAALAGCHSLASFSSAQQDIAAKLTAALVAGGAPPPPDRTFALAVQDMVRRVGAVLANDGAVAALAALAAALTLMWAPNIGRQVQATGALLNAGLAALIVLVEKFFRRRQPDGLKDCSARERQDGAEES